MTLTQQIITIGLCILGTMTTRFLPFIIFSENRKTPEFIQYIGKYLPSAVFGMLIIYCLRNVDVLHGTHGLPEAVSILITTEYVPVHRCRNDKLYAVTAFFVTLFFIS